MPANNNYRPEPEVDTDRFAPSYDDWQEMAECFADWQNQWDAEMDRYWEDRAMDEANMELIAVDSP